MSSRQPTPAITPHPGYLLAKPYVPNNETFSAARIENGEDQKSIVLAVGDSVTDSSNITRSAGVGVGDVIIHAQTNKTMEINFDQFRFVHFTEVHGVWNVKEASAKQ